MFFCVFCMTIGTFRVITLIMMETLMRVGDSLNRLATCAWLFKTYDVVSYESLTL